MTRTVLITGGIGSGKSVVRAYLEAKGFPAYDCDSRVKALYDSVPGLRERAQQATGLPFAQLSKVFDDPAALKALEDVVYPEALRDIAEWKASQSGELLFVESAIALQKPQFASTYDSVWLVEAPLSKRLSRNPEAARRSAMQAPVDPSKVDITIVNDGSIEELYKKIDNILNHMDNVKTDLSKILSVAGKHGLYRFLALSRGNSVIAEALSDGHRTIFDSRSRVTTLADIAIFTSEGELKLKEVFLALNKALEGKDAPSIKDDKAVKALFEKAVPNYDADRFYASHMRKVLEWYNEIVLHASLDFVEEETESEEAEA